MKRGTIIGLSIAGLLLIFGLVVFNSYRSAYDRNVQLTSKFEAQKGVVELSYDKMWKVLKTQASVPDQAAKAFKDMYVPLIEGRYSKGDGSLMKWITEQNPQFDFTMYSKLMDNIEALRSEFQMEQTKVLAIKEQHDNLRKEFWSSIWLGDVKEFEYQKITSTQTQEVVKTGKDDDIDLFGKDEKK